MRNFCSLFSVVSTATIENEGGKKEGTKKSRYCHIFPYHFHHPLHFFESFSKAICQKTMFLIFFLRKFHCRDAHLICHHQLYNLLWSRSSQVNWARGYSFFAIRFWLRIKKICIRKRKIIQKFMKNSSKKTKTKEYLLTVWFAAKTDKP